MGSHGFFETIAKLVFVGSYRGSITPVLFLGGA